MADEERHVVVELARPQQRELVAVVQRKFWFGAGRRIHRDAPPLAALVDAVWREHAQHDAVARLVQLRVPSRDLLLVPDDVVLLGRLPADREPRPSRRDDVRGSRGAVDEFIWHISVLRASARLDSNV